MRPQPHPDFYPSTVTLTKSQKLFWSLICDTVASWKFYERCTYFISDYIIWHQLVWQKPKFDSIQKLYLSSNWRDHDRHDNHVSRQQWNHILQRHDSTNLVMGMAFYLDKMDAINAEDAPFPADRTQLPHFGGYELYMRLSIFETSPTFQHSCSSACSRRAKSFIRIREHAAEVFMAL